MTITVEQNELIAAKIHLPADFKMSIDIIMEMLAESKLSNADAIISNYDKAASRKHGKYFTMEDIYNLLGLEVAWLCMPLKHVFPMLLLAINARMADRQKLYPADAKYHNEIHERFKCHFESYYRALLDGVDGHFTGGSPSDAYRSNVDTRNWRVPSSLVSYGYNPEALTDGELDLAADRSHDVTRHLIRKAIQNVSSDHASVKQTFLRLAAGQWNVYSVQNQPAVNWLKKQIILYALNKSALTYEDIVALKGVGAPK